MYRSRSVPTGVVGRWVDLRRSGCAHGRRIYPHEPIIGVDCKRDRPVVGYVIATRVFNDRGEHE